MLEKKDKDKRFIENWTPISLLNTDMKIISKAYIKNRFISESGRLVSHILVIGKTLALEGFLVTIDIEKTFDSVNHCFLWQILQKFGFAIDFASWIKTI